MPDINSILQSQANILDQEITRLSLKTTKFWIDAVPKAVYKDGQGVTPKTITYDPTSPETEPAWTDVELNDGTGSVANVTPSELKVASTARSYKLQRAVLATEYVTLDDIRHSHLFEQQLDAAFVNATANIMNMKENRNRDEYVRLCEHKVIVDSSFTENDTAFPLSEATARVSGDVLEYWYRALMDMSADIDGGSIETVDGAPQFIAVMSPELNKAIVRGDYQVREDFRNSNRSNELLRALGVAQPYNGFFHVSDFKAPRWNYTGGAWVRVPFWTTQATTKGSKNVRNPAYATATHEDTILFVPSVYECQVPKPLAKPGGHTEFNPSNYQGEWEWVNPQHATDNPFRNHGRFMGQYYSASRPINPGVGITLRGLRSNMVTTFVDADGEVVA
jgi:hypothetical protein